MVRNVQELLPEDSALILDLRWIGPKIKIFYCWKKWEDTAYSTIKQAAGSGEPFSKWLLEVTARGVWDRFTLLFRRYKSKTSWELKGSGSGGEELTEYEILIEDMIALSEESDKKAESEAANADTDWQKTLEIRKKAMETMGESKKRLAVDEEGEDLELIPCRG